MFIYQRNFSFRLNSIDVTEKQKFIQSIANLDEGIGFPPVNASTFSDPINFLKN